MKPLGHFSWSSNEVESVCRDEGPEDEDHVAEGERKSNEDLADDQVVISTNQTLNYLTWKKCDYF